MHERQETYVRDHIRNGHFVEGHYRSGTLVATELSFGDRIDKIIGVNKNFKCRCWWCGSDVYFHRDKNGGCVLFDNFGSPWPVHSCWHRMRHEDEIFKAVKGMIINHSERIISITSKNTASDKNIPTTEFEAFLIRIDLSRRLIINNRLRFRYFTYESTKYRTLQQVLIPEIEADKFICTPLIKLNLIAYKRKNATAIFLDTLKINKLITNNLESMNGAWIHQQKLKPSERYLTHIRSIVLNN